jgi:hypothetical protein
MMVALTGMPVLLLVQDEVRGGVLPDIVTDPPAGGDEVLRMLIAQVHEDPEQGLDRILGALRPSRNRACHVPLRFVLT